MKRRMDFGTWAMWAIPITILTTPIGLILWTALCIWLYDEYPKEQERKYEKKVNTFWDLNNPENMTDEERDLIACYPDLIKLRYRGKDEPLEGDFKTKHCYSCKQGLLDGSLWTNYFNSNERRLYYTIGKNGKDVKHEEWIRVPRDVPSEYQIKNPGWQRGVRYICSECGEMLEEYFAWRPGEDKDIPVRTRWCQYCHKEVKVYHYIDAISNIPFDYLNYHYKGDAFCPNNCSMLIQALPYDVIMNPYKEKIKHYKGDKSNYKYKLLCCNIKDYKMSKKEERFFRDEHYITLCVQLNKLIKKKEEEIKDEN